MFNDTILNHFLAPYHRGDFGEADVIGQDGIEGEGPYMEIALQMDGERIRQGHFETYGCPAAIACGSRLMQWIEGETVADAADLKAEELSALLGGLPLGKEHCARIAISALNSALRQWEKRKAQTPRN